MAWRKPTNLRQWLRLLLRHRKKFFFPAMLGAIVVVVASHYVPREYQAQGRFQRLNDPAMGAMGAGILERNLDPIRKVLLEDFRGRDAIEQVIHDLNLTRDLPHDEQGDLTLEGRLLRQELVQQIQSNISISFAIQSDQIDQITVTYTDVNRELAPKVVNQLIENYIRRTRQQLDDMLLNAKSFFEREVSRQRLRISELEGRKLRFEMNHPGLMPDEPNSIRFQYNDLQAQHRQVANQLEVARQQREALRGWIQHQPELIERRTRERNPAMLELAQRRQELEQELESHLHEWSRTELHPDVIRTRRQIEQLDRQMNQTEAEVDGIVELQPNINRLNTEQRIEELNGTILALELQSNELADRLESLGELDRNFFNVRGEYLSIIRELNEAREQLAFWDGNLRRTVIALTAEVGNRGVRLAVIQRAGELGRPSRPTVLGILAASLIVGLGLGAGCVLLAELLNHSFSDPEQALDELKLPVLGSVNEIITPVEAFRRRMMRWAVYPPLALVMLIAFAASLTMAWLSLEHPHRYEQVISKPGQVLKAVGDIWPDRFGGRAREASMPQAMQETDHGRHA